MRGVLVFLQHYRLSLIFQEGNLGTSTFLREEMELREGVDEANEEGDEGRGARKRRHSPTAMNAWYNELGGRNKDPDYGVGSVAAKVRG